MHSAAQVKMRVEPYQDNVRLAGMRESQNFLETDPVGQDFGNDPIQY
jgi:hypothetical protein